MIYALSPQTIPARYRGFVREEIAQMLRTIERDIANPGCDFPPELLHSRCEAEDDQILLMVLEPAMAQAAQPLKAA